MRYEKCAVFQVSDGDGLTRLICVEGPTFADGVELERAFRAQGARRLHVIFLGRFDHIEIASGVAEFLNLALGPNAAASTLTPVSAQRPYQLEF
jgi:hypothetical protein